MVDELRPRLVAVVSTPAALSIARSSAASRDQTPCASRASTNFTRAHGRFTSISWP